jgi:hypothetical protein
MSQPPHGTEVGVAVADTPVACHKASAVLLVYCLVLSQQPILLWEMLWHTPTSFPAAHKGCMGAWSLHCLGKLHV